MKNKRGADVVMIRRMSQSPASQRARQTETDKRKLVIKTARARVVFASPEEVMHA